MHALPRDGERPDAVATSRARWRCTIGIALAAISLWVARTHAQCGVGPCLEAHGGGGCDDADCCAEICAFDPLCCEESWTENCATNADTMCEICGASVTGSCFAPHPLASCADAACCGVVCDQDPFCCTQSWDSLCAAMATLICNTAAETCGSPTAGDCHVPNGTPACSDLDCCVAVCALAPECCELAWDFICAAIADGTCVAGGCTVVCAGEAEVHPEPCQSIDASCTQLTTTLAPGIPWCGDLPVSDGIADLDVYAVTIPDPDGDGLARVTLMLEAAEPSFAALVASPCAPWTASPLVVQTTLCGEVFAQACVPAGQWRLVVQGGEFPAAATSNRPCGASQYEVLLTADQVCGDVCGTGPACTVVHAAPGCSDAACCQAVCADDPLCCSLSWDAVCVKSAAALCGGVPPVNDACAAAIPIGPGAHSFEYILATLDGPDLPSECTPTGSKNVARDVWFLVEGVEGLVRISTCGGEAHPTLQTYAGDCTAPTLITCAQPVLGDCPGGTGTALVAQATCGASLLLRVGILPGTAAPALLVIEGTACPACDADLDHDGDVSGGDLAILLGAWGTPDVTADLNGDGNVTGGDLAILLGAWGPCP